MLGRRSAPGHSRIGTATSPATQTPRKLAASCLNIVCLNIVVAPRSYFPLGISANKLLLVAFFRADFESTAARHSLAESRWQFYRLPIRTAAARRRFARF